MGQIENNYPAKKKRVLIVDEEETIRFLLSETLRPFGCEIDTAEDGESAIQQVSKNFYDLIITDSVIPKINGLELTRRISKLDPLLPILVLANGGYNDDFLNSGALACLQKPFSIPEIQLISRVILGNDLPRPAA